MADLRFFFVPSVLLAASVGYVVLNPSGAALEPLATETPTATERPTYTPQPTATPVPVTLDGLKGTLTWQTANDGLRSVAFPSGASVKPPTIDDGSWNASSDGVWHYESECDDGRCAIRFWSRDGRSNVLPGRYALWHAAWQPGANAFAMSVSQPNASAADRIIVVDDPAAPWERTLYDAAYGVRAFAWATADGTPLLLIADGDNGGARLQLVDMHGARRGEGADVPATGALFHPSPDGQTFAFTVSHAAGWRLMTVDALTETITDHGAMGSDGPDGLPVPDAPDNGKGPMYIAWSPNGSKLAFGGGFEPPYIMTTVDVASNSVALTEFPSGYPGEIKWSRDGTSIAVSTYDVNRTHHETWVVDPASGAGTHLMDGCVIVWSPDSRFLAVHGEDRPGIAVIDATSGERMQLTSDPADVPISWTAEQLTD